MAKRCILEQKLLLTAYRKSYMRNGTKMNDLDLCLEVVLRSCQPLIHIRHWISLKPLEIYTWCRRTNKRKRPMGNQMWPWKVKLVTQICLECNISKTAADRDPVPKTTNRKWPMWYQMVTWSMTSRDHERCCEAVRSAILATAWLLVNTRHQLTSNWMLTNAFA